jgi:hypothetical protein
MPNPKKFKIYQMHPFFYCAQGKGGLQAMIDAIPDIAAMGFTHVWLNPIFEVGIATKSDENGKETFVRRDGVTVNGKKNNNVPVTGSIYAATWREDQEGNFYLFQELLKHEPGNTWEEKQKSGMKKLQILIDTIRQFNMVPAFDFVSNHIASQSSCIQNAELRVSDGNGGTVSIFQDHPHPLYNDVHGFRYGTREQALAVFRLFWQGKIEKLFALGFCGVRVDCVAYADTEIQKIATRYISKRLSELGIPKSEQLIFGELVSGAESSPQFLEAHGLFNMVVGEDRAAYTCFMNGVNWAIPTSLCDEQVPLCCKAHEHFVQEIVRKEVMLSFGISADMPFGSTGTISPSSVHDGNPLGVIIWEKRGYHTYRYPNDAEFMHDGREKFLMSAISGKRGWFCQSGDQYLDMRDKSPTFAYLVTNPYAKPNEPYILEYLFEDYKDFAPKFDLREYIKGVNELIDKIEYEPDKPPICLFMHLHGNPNLFIAYGNFKYNGKNYVAVDLSRERLTTLSLSEGDERNITMSLDWANPIYRKQIEELEKTLKHKLEASKRPSSEPPGAHSVEQTEMHRVSSALFSGSGSANGPQSGLGGDPYVMVQRPEEGTSSGGAPGPAGSVGGKH